jgi:AcrR family transcriptional regulator
MGEVASRAGVAPATAAAAFGGKAALLKQLVDIAIVGDDEPIPVRERQVAADVAASSDPREQIELLGSFITEVHGRVAALLEVMQQASGSDPEVFADLGRLQRGRHEGMAEFVGLIDSAALADGLGPERSADIVWALTDSRVYRGLVNERGWSSAEYSVWLVDQLSHALLRSG